MDKRYTGNATTGITVALWYLLLRYTLSRYTGTFCHIIPFLRYIFCPLYLLSHYTFTRLYLQFVILIFVMPFVRYTFCHVIPYRYLFINYGIPFVGLYLLSVIHFVMLYLLSVIVTMVF